MSNASFNKLSVSFDLLVYKKIKFIELLLERHKELTHESTKYAYVDTFTTYLQPCQMYAVSWCFCKLLCCSRKRYSLLVLVKVLYSFLSHLLIFQWVWLTPPTPLGYVVCSDWNETSTVNHIVSKLFTLSFWPMWWP